MQVLLKGNLQKAQERMTYYANKKRTDRSFKEGDEVFLKVQAFRQSSLKATKDNKFSPKYYGPFKILKKIGAVAYRLQLPATARIHNTFHVSLLKKKVGDASMVSSDLPTTTAPAPEHQKSYHTVFLTVASSRKITHPPLLF